jgi:hypothetical protein
MPLIKSGIIASRAGTIMAGTATFFQTQARCSCACSLSSRFLLSLDCERRPRLDDLLAGVQGLGVVDSAIKQVFFQTSTLH